MLVNLEDLVEEVQKRLDRKANLEAMIQQADGLRVVGGIKGEKKEAAKEVEDVKTEEAKTGEQQASAEAEGKENVKSEPEVAAPKIDVQPDTEKPKEESLQSQEAIGAVPAS